METLINQIKTAREMKNLRNKQKEFNDRMVKITNKYQKIYNFKIDKNNKGHETWNNEADAFKHTFGSALMEFEMGSLGSLVGGIYHENQTRNNPKGEWNMDSWNNREGRNIAKEIKKEYGEKEFRGLPKEKQEDIIAQKVMIKMKNGDLIASPDDKREFKGFWEKTLSKPKERINNNPPKGTPTGFAAPVSSPISNKRKDNEWTDKDDKAFLEGFDTNEFTKEGEKSAKIKEKIQKEKYEQFKKRLNVGNPETDKGHWVTLKNHKRLFIKDKN